MKTPNESEITTFLEKLRKHIRAVEKARGQLAGIQADADQFGALITKIGDPHYKDDKGVNDLLAAQHKLKSCQRTLEATKATIGKHAGELAKLIEPGARMAGAVLSEVINNRLETVSATLAPFSLNHGNAVKVAKQTDACLAATHAVGRYLRMTSKLRPYLRAGESEEDYIEYAASQASPVLAQSQKIERVLSEALTRAPDLLQFITFTPNKAENTTPAEQE